MKLLFASPYLLFSCYAVTSPARTCHAYLHSRLSAFDLAPLKALTYESDRSLLFAPPQDHVTREHRGIGFVTFGTPDAVDRVMADSHQLGGTTVAIDRATPKDDGGGRKGPMGGGMGGRGGPGRGQSG
eukprot:800847-Prorocentrum_minimum.AAC.8